MTDLSQVSDADLLSSLPRGIRNNNPLNLKTRGTKGQDGPFAVYNTQDEGIAAADRNLQAYSTKHGLNTVAGIVNRWAPPNADGNHTAAYTAHVASRMGVDPNGRLDMVNPQTRKALIGAMGEFENGTPIAQQAPANPLEGVSDADLLASLPKGRPPQRGQTGGTQQNPIQLTTANRDQVPEGAFFRTGTGEIRQQKTGAGYSPDRPTSQALGFKTELLRVAERVAPYSPLALIPGYRDKLAEGKPRVDAALARDAQTQRPGKIGAFGADVLAGIGMGGPFNPVVSGVVSGVATGDSTDLRGVGKDAVFGGAMGRLGALGSDPLQITGRKLLSKAPGVMKLPELQAAKKAAYEAVDNSGFAFPRAKVQGLVADFEKTVGARALSKSAKEDAASIIKYARGLAGGDLPLSQLDKLRTDIYDSMVAKGGDTANIGGAFRAKIDGLISTAAKENSLVRTARDLNARFKKADYVTRASGSADLAAEKTYGGDYGRKIKDRVAPLVDPLSKQKNFRGATPDETKALNKVARGTKLQNATSTVAGMLDPRRLGGKMVSTALTTLGGAGAPFSGGATMLIPAAQMGTGLALTGITSKIARGNVDDLLKLISAGGSKQALKAAQAKSIPTAASQATEEAIARLLRPAAVATAVPALAAARRQRENPTPAPKKPKPRPTSKGR